MLILGSAYFLTAFCAHSQESTGRLSVAPLATAPAASPAPATTPAPNPALQPVAKAPEPTSNVVDAPLPEIANQPKVITPSQTSTSDGPKGPRDGRWYVAGGAGAMVQQFINNGTATISGTPSLDQSDSGNLGFYAEGKVGYDFAVRDVQLAFGGPTPMRTAMELEFGYLGSHEKIPLQNGGIGVGTETYNLSAYSVMLNGLIKFEDLPVTPYFGGGVGAATLYSYNHKIVVDGYTGTNEAYNATTSVNNANNVCLSLQAIVGLERQLYQGLSMYIEYKFLAFMDVNFTYGNTGWNPSTPNVPPGSNNSNNFLAQQIVSAGLKWGF
jgi:opacity protein-like surface antigen